MTTRKLADCEDELHERARRETGFNDFGDPAYREGLRVLLEAFDHDRRLTETGRQATCQGFVHLLSARLYAQKGWADNPGVLGTPIHRPLIIAGFPRTGTTALHRLLSVDPQFQGLEYWLECTPMIRPPPETWGSYPEYQARVAELERIYAQDPEVRKAHETVAGEVESCLFILRQSFVTSIWSFYTNLPTYDSWLRTQSALGTYRYYVNVLRLIGARDPQKRWLLKTPFHMVEIDTLLKVFPDACIVQTHRDPLRVIPSQCSMMRPSEEYEVGPFTPDGPRVCAF